MRIRATPPTTPPTIAPVWLAAFETGADKGVVDGFAVGTVVALALIGLAGTFKDDRKAVTALVAAFEKSKVNSYETL